MGTEWAPEGWRLSRTKVDLLCFYYRFQELYLSAIWAGVISVAFVLADIWAHGKSWLPKSKAVSKVEVKVLFWIFVTALVLSFIRYALADWRIWYRLRRAARRSGLDLRSRANALATDWLWSTWDGSDETRLPFGMDPTSAALVGNRCWMLSSPTDPWHLLLVSHTPKAATAGLITGRGSKVIEIVSVMFFGRSPLDRVPLPRERRERVEASGYQIVQSNDGLWINKTRAAGGWGNAATKQVQTEEIASLWKYCWRS